MNIRLMEIGDFAACYDLWLHTPGMGLNSIDDSPKGIGRQLVEYVMAAMGRRASSRSNWWCSPTTKKSNAFWESLGFTVRTDLTYRNKRIRTAVRMAT